MAFDTQSVPGILRARAYGDLSGSGFRRQMLATPRLAERRAEAFLQELQGEIGADQFALLVERVTFGEGVFSDVALVKRLIAREFFHLRYLLDFPQSQDWIRTVEPLLILPAPPDYLSVADYLSYSLWGRSPRAEWPPGRGSLWMHRYIDTQVKQI